MAMNAHDKAGRPATVVSRLNAKITARHPDSRFRQVMVLGIYVLIGFKVFGWIFKWGLFSQARHFGDTTCGLIPDFHEDLRV